MMTTEGAAYVVIVAARVRAEMGRQRRTGQDLAVLLGVDRRTAARRLNGEVPFTVSEVAGIADWLEVDCVSMFAEAES